MSVTRLKRKHRKNIARANNEVKKIKDLLRTPVLKNVDLDELKAKFSQAAPPDVAAKSNKARVPATDQAAAEKQAKLAEKLDEVPAPKAKAKAEPEAKSESLLDKVGHAAAAAADTVKHAAADAVDAVAHSSVVEKAREVAANAVDAVTHSAAYEAAQQAAHNVVEGTKHVLDAQQEPAKNEEAKVNQTGTVGFDEAEALTKPVTEEGQAGEHPKPEIHL